MWMRTLALIALAPALAFARTSVSRHARAAEPATNTDEQATQFVIGKAGADISLDKLRVVVRGGDATTVRLALTLSTRSNERRQAVIPLALPDGARIVGAAVTIGSTPRVVANPLAPMDARTTYQELFTVGKDPLLVERVNPELDALLPIGPAREPQGDHMRTTVWDAFAPVPARATDRTGLVEYVVRAFPLTKLDTARVELTIELASYDSTRLVIAHAQRIGIVEVERPMVTEDGETLDPEICEPAIVRRVNVRAPIASTLPPMRRMPIAFANFVERAHVDTSHSLFAGWAAPTAVVPIVHIGGPVRGPLFSSVDKRTIRSVVKQHLPQLRRCYTAVTEYRGGQEGTAVMHFFISTDGTVASVNVDGELEDPRITSCLADQVRQWEFHPGDTGTMVNYPLTFRLAR